jgi:hypothetical protein
MSYLRMVSLHRRHFVEILTFKLAIVRIIISSYEDRLHHVFHFLEFKGKMPQPQFVLQKEQTAFIQVLVHPRHGKYSNHKQKS